MNNHLQSFDVCIVCALPEEVKAFLAVVKPHFEDGLGEHTSSRYGYSYRSAELKNEKDELLTLHISWLPRYGPQEMTLHLSHVLEECQPRIAIMTGICAGDSQQVHLGDLVVAERTFTYDNGKFAFDDDGRRVHLHDTMTYQLDANTLQFLGLFDNWKPLVVRLKRPPSPLEQRKRRKIVCHIKPMASGSAVRADHPFEDVQAPVRGTVAIDMESAAFGLVMSRHPQIPWMVVKGVCDYADRTKNDTYHDYAARASALYALSFIQKYAISQRLPLVNKSFSASEGTRARALPIFEIGECTAGSPLEMQCTGEIIRGVDAATRVIEEIELDIKPSDNIRFDIRVTRIERIRNYLAVIDESTDAANEECHKLRMALRDWEKHLEVFRTGVEFVLWNSIFRTSVNIVLWNSNSSSRNARDAAEIICGLSRHCFGLDYLKLPVEWFLWYEDEQKTLRTFSVTEDVKDFMERGYYEDDYTSGNRQQGLTEFRAYPLAVFFPGTLHQHVIPPLLMYIAEQRVQGAFQAELDKYLDVSRWKWSVRHPGNNSLWKR